MRELKQEQWLRVAGDQVALKEEKGICYQWKAKGQCSRGDKCSFGHDEDKRAKPTPKTLNHQRKEVEVHRGNRTSEAGVHLGSSLDNRAETT